MLDKNQYDKLFKEVGSYRLVSVSVLVDRLKINGSLARRALVELAEKGIIKEIETHHAQKIYSKFCRQCSLRQILIAVQREHLRRQLLDV